MRPKCVGRNIVAPRCSKFCYRQPACHGSSLISSKAAYKAKRFHYLLDQFWGEAPSCVVKGREARRVQLDAEQFTALESVIGNEYTEALGFASLPRTSKGWGLRFRPSGGSPWKDCAGAGSTKRSDTSRGSGTG